MPIINPDGISIIKRYERFYPESYKCPAGVWTVGYGHTQNVKPGQIITRAEAEILLRSDLQNVEKELKHILSDKLVNLNQWSAIVSLCFNIGVGNFEHSDLLHYLSDPQKAADAFLLLDHAHVHGKICVLPGLLRRRKEERELFLK